MELDSETEDAILIEKCRKKAKEKVLTNAFTQLYTQQIYTNKPLDDRILKHAQMLTQKSLKLRKKKRSSEYYFVSVSPESHHTIEDLKYKVEKYVDRKLCVGTIYAYEWNKRGIPHVHILVRQLEYSDTDFRKNTYNSFKTLVGNKKCVDIRAIPEDWVDDKIDYIKGDKWDIEKEELIKIDIQNRLEYRLEPFYTTGTFIRTERERPPLDGGSPDIS